MYSLQRLAALFLGTTMALLPIAVFALPTLERGLTNPAPGAGTTLQDFVYLLIDIIQWIALPLLALLIIRAGYLLVSAGGDEKKLASGKTWLVSTLIGVVVVLGAEVIADVIFGTAELLE